MPGKWIYMVLPFTRLELPGWGKLLKLAKIDFSPNSEMWKNAPHKIIHGKLHGYLMQLDLSDWSQRETYFLGRYYERAVQQLMIAILKKDDRFVDIGTNIGMISMLGAYLVGKNGRVDGFEPNQDCVALFKNNLDLNAIEHVKIHPVGLSDSNQVLPLNLTSEHTGTATLASVSGVINSYDVNLVIGDDVLLSYPMPINLIKIDVEGYEMHVLKGLTKTLHKYKPPLITEFIESHFIRAGTNSNEIKMFLKSFGYIPYGIDSRRKWLRYQPRLSLLRLDTSSWGFNDILWIHEDDSRLSGVIKKYICN